MKRKGKLFFIPVSILLIITSCGKDNAKKETGKETIQSSEAVSNKEQEIQKPDKTFDLKSCNGDWSLDGQGHDAVVAEGGAFLSCKITNGDEFSGHIFTQQGATERFAELDINGTIQNNQLEYAFKDDGWGGNGTLCLDFSEDKIIASVKDYVMAEDNLSGYGLSGTYEFVKCGENAQMKDISAMTEKELERAISERSQYYQKSGYYDEVTNYWEKVRGVTDVANVLEPLFETDRKTYSESDFKDTPAVIIHLAKNEIYARHGYVFQDKDLKNYFMGCVWYEPLQDGKSFSDAVFNKMEKQNLEVLSKLER